MGSRPFAQRWFWPAVVAILGATALALAGVAVWRFQIEKVAAANAAAHYTAPAVSITQMTTATVYGDSYAAGTGATSPSRDFISIVAANAHWTVENLAQGGTGYVTQGSNVCDGGSCPTFDTAIANGSQASKVVLVEGGRNDVFAGTSDLRAGIRNFYNDLRLKYPRATIYAVSPIWDRSTPPASLAAIQTLVKANVERVGGRYLDIGEPLRARPGLISADQVHPNDAGHAAIAAAIMKDLK